MEFLQVYDIHDAMDERNRPVNIPETVKLPLLSVRANQTPDHTHHTAHKELWEYRTESQKWGNSMPLLKVPQVVNDENTPDTVSKFLL